MATVLKLGPADHGRPLTLEEFEQGEYEAGYKYELINGRLYVVPQPNPPEEDIVAWLSEKLSDYSKKNPGVINKVTNQGRVFLPGEESTTRPEPDLTAFIDYPRHLPRAERHWEDMTPLLVIEVLGSDPDKDLERNVDLYFRVPSIREYWVFDIRDNPDQPTMKVHRRHGSRWVIRDYRYGDTYTTRTLPGFELIIDPDR